MIVLGTTNAWLSDVLTAVAVSRVDSAVVAMLQAAVPLVVAVLAHFTFVEEPFRRFIGIMTELTGIRGSCTSASRAPNWSLLPPVPANLLHRPGYHHLGGIIEADNPGAVEGVHYNASPHRVRGTLIAVAGRPGARGRS